MNKSAALPRLPYPARDASGRALRVGDWVRLSAIPDPVAHMPETLAVFQRALGGTFRIEAFDDNGLMELAVWRKLKLRGMDVIWLEPSHCQRSRRTRAG